MGVMQRQAWMATIDAVDDTPDWLKQQQRDLVVAWDGALSQALGNLELAWRRAVAIERRAAQEDT